MEAVPVALREGGRVAVPAEEAEEHRGRDPVALAGPLPLGRGDLFSVDVKKRAQRERLGLGFRLAVQVRSDETGGEFVRLPLRPHPIAVPQRPGESSPILAPLQLEQAGFRVGEHPHPVPAPFTGAVGAPASFRACHHSIPLVMDCTICATESSRREAVYARCEARGGGILPETASAAMRPVAVLELVDVQARSRDFESFSTLPLPFPSVSGTLWAWPDTKSPFGRTRPQSSKSLASLRLRHGQRSADADPRYLDADVRDLRDAWVSIGKDMPMFILPGRSLPLHQSLAERGATSGAPHPPHETRRSRGNVNVSGAR